MAKKPTTKSEDTKAEETSNTAAKEVASYNQEEAKTIKVKAQKDTQLYDPATKTLYTADKATEAREGDQFVVTNLNRGKLVKA